MDFVERNQLKIFLAAPANIGREKTNGVEQA
jgi:hypothetical protein